MYKQCLKFIFDKKFRFNMLASRNFLFGMSDEDIIKKMYLYRFGKKLDLQDPKTYQEKLQWLKLYDRKDIYTTMVDKYEMKKFVSNKIGTNYVVPNLGVWNSFDEIDFDKLPNQFVLKCTHDSGGVVICKDKELFDFKAARKLISKCLKRNYYFVGREWPYKNMKPRIIAEQFLEDIDDGELRDYKFFTFSGIPKIMYITQGRANGKSVSADFFDMNFNHLDLCMDHELADVEPHRPTHFDKMKELAEVLSESTIQLRVDFYEVNGKIYVGELTFFHCSGFAPIKPDYWNETLAQWITLPKKKEY